METAYKKNGSPRVTTDLSSYTFGKLPPQAKDLEKAVIAACLLSKYAILKSLTFLTPDSFYTNAYRVIFEAITILYNKGTEVDCLTVGEELKRMGKLEEVGGEYFITEIGLCIDSPAHVEHHALIIQQKYLQRQLIVNCSEAIREAYEDTTDVFDAITTHANEVNKLLGVSPNAKHVSLSVEKNKALFLQQIDSDEAITGYTSGLYEVDKLGGGYQPGELIIVAARPGMGKTSFVLTSAKANCERGKAVAIFSHEMSAQQLTLRLLSMLTGIDSERLRLVRRGSLTESEIEAYYEACDTLKSWKLYIDDSRLSITEVRARAARLKMEHGIDLFIGDYLQLKKGDNKNHSREQEVSSVSRGLKQIAMELNVPWVEAAQLSREVEKRNDNRPQLSDLRESGAIEQDADVVCFLFRPEYYGITQDDNNQDLRGLAEIIYAKNRNGKIGSAWVQFRRQQTEFKDIENEI